MLEWLKRLLPHDDPLERPCSCGKKASVAVAPEAESEASAATAYCLSCLEPVLRDGLARVRGGWVAVEPFAGAPCYVPYTLQELADSPEFTPWPPEDILRLIEGARGPCERCGATGDRLLWLPTAADQDLSALQGDAEWFRGKTGQPLCKDCLGTALMASLRERRLQVYEFVLPEVGPGVWLPWAY